MPKVLTEAQVSTYERDGYPARLVPVVVPFEVRPGSRT